MRLSVAIVFLPPNLARMLPEGDLKKGPLPNCGWRSSAEVEDVLNRRRTHPEADYLGVRFRPGASHPVRSLVALCVRDRLRMREP